jgi:RHS repeat-associated protein
MARRNVVLFKAKYNRKSKRLLCQFVLAVSFSASLLLTAAQARGQGGDPAAEFGFKPYGSFSDGNIDAINLLNQNLNVRIPLVSFPQRGGKRLSFSVGYFAPTLTSKLDGPNCSSDPRTCNEDWSMTPNLSVPIAGIVIVPDSLISVQSPWLDANANIWFSTSDGATHSAAPAGGYVSDGTGYHVTASREVGCVILGTTLYDQLVVITDTAGTRSTYHVPYPGVGCGGWLVSVEDANGNTITPNYSTSTGGTLSGFTDTLGRTISWPYVAANTTTDLTGCTGSLPMQPTAYTWTIPSPKGGAETYKVCIGTVTINLPGCQNAQGNHTERCIFEPAGSRTQSIVLPNGTAWTFGYDSSNGSSYAFGDLTQITFPTGGTISYSWASTGGFANCTSGRPWAARGVQSRTVNANDGQGPHQTTYTATIGSGNDPTIQTTVQDPIGDQAVHTFTDVLADCSYYETQAQYSELQNGTQVSLKTVGTTYNTAGYPPLPATITTTWPDGHVSQIQEDYDGSTFGNVTALREYDYGSGAPGAILRQTLTTYQYQISSPYKTNNLVRLPATITVEDGSGNQKAQTKYGYDASSLASSGITTQHDSAPPAGSSRGNQTSAQRWLNTTNTFLTSTNVYFDTGTIQTATDPKGNPTAFAYSSTYVGAYPTTITNPLHQVTTNSYDFDTGLITSRMDPNQQTTTYNYDQMWRPTSISYPVGGSTSYCYTDDGATCGQSSSPNEVVATQAITSSANKTSTLVYDGLGRVLHTQLNSDPEGVDYVDLTYDALGNKATATNPYRTTSNSTYGITRNTYDALHRVTRVTKPDASTVQTAYCDNSTLTTDESGHWRRAKVDGLGRLIEVDEPNSSTATVNPNGCPGSNDPIWVTTYGYDVLDNLTSVIQAGSRQRSFVYDSLSRLLSGTNPESGTLTYTYDADGNVITKVTPQQNQTNPSITTTLSYCYDSLNRVTSKAYSAQSCPMTSPVATYSYDGSSCLGQASCYNIGHRTSMTDAAGSESWVYDALGRAFYQSRTINNVTKTTSYTYNLDSSVASLTNPSGRIITYTPDTAGRPSNVMDHSTSVYYATGTCANDVSGNGACYAPQGAIAELQNGSSLFSTHIYNNRLQPCWMYTTTGTALAWSTTLCTGTATAGNMLDLKYNFSLGSDNGNPTSITNNRVSDRSQTFTYDQSNRIATAQTTATHSSDSADCWGQAFGYDSTGNWGNLLSIGGASSAYSACTQGSLSIAVNTANQITGDTYDAAGNLWVVLGAGGATYTYNAENQITSTSNSSMTYIYDGDGNRVEKSGTEIYWYGGSNVLDETDTTGSTTNSSFNEYVFFGGNRIARRDSSGDVFYNLSDHLATSRVIAEVASGKTTPTLCYDADFEPFGAEHAYTSTCSQKYKFTGKERDTESGLDNFGKRYNASTIGRFMSPDAFFKDSHVGDPQSWNEYTYVRNNPLRYTDPTGSTATISTSCSTDANNQTICNVNISASIAIYAATGSGITQNQLNAAAGTMQNSIQNAWSGSFTQDGVSYNVSTQVSVSVADSQSAAMSSGAQNVIGMTNGDPAPNTGAYVNPKSLWGALTGGPDTGMMDINGVDNSAKHEFTHLLGVNDRGDYDVPDSGPAVMSNTWPGRRPDSATGQDLGWGIKEATQSVGLGLSMKNWYNGSNGPLPSPFNFSATDHVGAPVGQWWK